MGDREQEVKNYSKLAKITKEPKIPQGKLEMYTTGKLSLGSHSDHVLVICGDPPSLLACRPSIQEGKEEEMMIESFVCSI